MESSRPVAVAAPDAAPVLPGADFSDAYRLIVSGQSLDALSAARRAMGRAPGWIGGLMRLRNLAVKPFGLKTEAKDMRDPGFNSFPLISASPERVVLGLDDKHLDFRVCIDVENLGDERQAITAATMVRTHNAFGRLYLAMVKPFHRMIVPMMLAQAAAK